METVSAAAAGCPPTRSPPKTTNRQSTTQAERRMYATGSCSLRRSPRVGVPSSSHHRHTRPVGGQMRTVSATTSAKGHNACSSAGRIGLSGGSVAERHRRKLRSGDGQGVAVEREQLGGDRDDVGLRDRAQLPRVSLEVIVAELEQLGLEHHRGDAVRALATDLELTDELVARQLQIVVDDGTVADLLELGERDPDRALDVAGVH